jgi:hypothetical protein
MDAEIGCPIKPEVGPAETEVQPRVQDRGGQACQERVVSVAQAGREQSNVHIASVTTLLVSIYVARAVLISAAPGAGVDF